jgi:hypothetical protein
VKDGYVLDQIDGWAGRDGRGSNEGGIPLIKQEPPNKNLEIFLLDMLAKLPERSLLSRAWSILDYTGLATLYLTLR